VAALVIACRHCFSGQCCISGEKNDEDPRICCGNTLCLCLGF
jgi:hypothetical protein